METRMETRMDTRMETRMDTRTETRMDKQGDKHDELEGWTMMEDNRGKKNKSFTTIEKIDKFNGIGKTRQRTNTRRAQRDTREGKLLVYF